MAPEVLVESERLGDSVTAHRFEAHPVHQTDVTTASGQKRRARRIVQRLVHPEDSDYGEQGVEESPERRCAQSPLYKCGRLHDYVVVGDESRLAVEQLTPYLSCLCVMGIVAVEERVQRRGIDQGRSGSRSWHTRPHSATGWGAR